MRAVGVCGTYSASALAIADLIVPRLNALRITEAGNGSALEVTAAGTT